MNGLGLRPLAFPHHGAERGKGWISASKGSHTRAPVHTAPRQRGAGETSEGEHGIVLLY